MAVKCPKCDEQVSRINGGEIAINVGLGKEPLNGIVFSCPRCRTVLGCQLAVAPARDKDDDDSKADQSQATSSLG